MPIATLRPTEFFGGVLFRLGPLRPDPDQTAGLEVRVASSPLLATSSAHFLDTPLCLRKLFDTGDHFDQRSLSSTETQANTTPGRTSLPVSELRGVDQELRDFQRQAHRVHAALSCFIHLLASILISFSYCKNLALSSECVPKSSYSSLVCLRVFFSPR